MESRSPGSDDRASGMFVSEAHLLFPKKTNHYFRLFRNLFSRAILLIWLALIFFAALPSQATPLQIVHNRLFKTVAGLQPIDRLPETNRLDLEIGLPYRNREELTNLLQELYDPANPSFHRFLTPEEFINGFGPAPEDYQAVIAFAKAHHLVITQTNANCTMVGVNGAVEDIDATFHVHLRVYHHPRENRTFFAPDAEPTLDLETPVLDIGGLNNYVIPRPMNLVKHALHPAAQAHSGSGPGGNFIGADFRAAYVPGVSLTGAGQTVGLLEFDGYYTNDIASYESQAGLSAVPVTTVLSGTANGTAGKNNTEVALDIEMLISMAPGLSNIVVYEGSSAFTMLTAMAANRAINQFSSSWTFDNTSSIQQLFQKFATQGQSYFNASGDNGAYVGTPTPPTDDPYVTAVGGTTLKTRSGAWSSETVWNWYTTGEGTNASSGGISSVFTIPSWQAKISMANNQGSSTERNVPDVALTADDIFVIDNDGSEDELGGTSAASPLWAGLAALMNQQATASGLSKIGFINPAVYNIALGSDYTNAFHDITTGNNTNSLTASEFFATAGYDLCTGLGTPNGARLIYDLVPVPLITAQPQSQTADQNNPVTFNVTAVGGPPLSYQWRLNGTNISQATSASFTIASVQAANQGNYSVLISNSTNSAVSSNAALTVILLPVITTQPQSVIVIADGNAGFSVSATGSALSYQWLYNNSPLTDGGAIAGSQTANLTLTGATAANAGNYAVVVSDTAGSVTSSAVSLTITMVTPVLTWNTPAPIVYGTALGANQLNATANEPGTFAYTPPFGSVLNVGTTTLSVVFTPNDTADFNSVTGSVSMTISPAPLTVTAANATRAYGQTNPTFSATILGAVNGDVFTASASSSATATNAPGNYPIVPSLSDPNNRLGNYTVNLVNGTLTITTAAAPTIASITPNFDSTNGGTTVSIIGTGFENGATVYFGSLAAASAAFVNATNLSVVTPASSPGVVDVVVTNADGQSVILTNGFSFGLPEITDQPTNQSVSLGENADFAVTATGAPPLAYQWLFNNTNLPGATNFNLLISNAQPLNAGPYFVIVTNNYGAATSAVVTLSIPNAPLFFSSGSGGIQYSNSEFVLQLSGLTGQGPVVIQTSTNLIDWISIYTNAPAFGQLQFVDPNASNYPANFYRAVTQSSP